MADKKKIELTKRDRLTLCGTHNSFRVHGTMKECRMVVSLTQ